MNAHDWSYKSEGTNHIVVCNRRREILKLKKRYHTEYVRLNDETFKSDVKICMRESEYYKHCLDFQRLVILPLLKHSNAVLIPVEVELPSDFIDVLSFAIETKRPMYRKRKALDSRRTALLTTDVTRSQLDNNILKTKSKFYPNVVCVELMVKKGLISRLDPLSDVSVCQFCSRQLYRKLHKKSLSKASSYCPLDLFSGDRSKMKSALRALIKMPYNNLKVFKNGEVVYCQNTVDNYPDSKIEGLEKELERLLFADFEKADINKMFYDVVVSALLHPIVRDSQSESEVPQSTPCMGPKYKTNIKINATLDELHSRERYTPSNVPPSSVLGILLRAQYTSIHGLTPSIIHDSIEKVKVHMSNPTSDFSLDAPYKTASWKRIGNNLLQDEK